MNSFKKYVLTVLTMVLVVLVVKTFIVVKEIPKVSKECENKTYDLVSGLYQTKSFLEIQELYFNINATNSNYKGAAENVMNLYKGSLEGRQIIEKLNKINCHPDKTVFNEAIDKINYYNAESTRMMSAASSDLITND